MSRPFAAGCVILVMLSVLNGCAEPEQQFRAAMRHRRAGSAGALASNDGDTPGAPARSDADGRLTWLALGERLAAKAEASETRPVRDARASRNGAEPVHWSKRRGPAYPDDYWRSVGTDLKELPATVWDDTKATFTNRTALVGFAAAVAAGAAIDAANWNGCAGDHYTSNGSQLNDFWDEVGEVGGNPGTHFAVAGAMYFTTLARKDVRNYEVSKALLNALAINGMTTLALKGVAHSDAPNGDPFGWPSGHTSSTFTVATVMHEAYGPWAGVPLFAFATFVGYERVDARNHDLNDVVSGALIGMAIGHAVWRNHEPRVAGWDVIPYADPRGGVGVALAKRW